MPTAENALLEFEAGQDAVPMSELTDSGDRTTFTSPADLWSRRSGFAPVVRPNGIRTGGEVTPAASGTADAVDVGAATAFQDGDDVSVAGTTDLNVARPSTDTHLKASIVIDDTGAYSVVQGATGTSFSDVRGNAGGPPFIPDGQIEVGQVWYSSQTSGQIASEDIHQVVNVHQERSDFPLWDVDAFNGQITFLSALPAIHEPSSDPAPKGVFASYAEPIFAEAQLASEFVPPENSHSVSSTQIYGTTLGSTSKSLNQGSFTAYLQDGVTDSLVQLKDEVLWFRFKPDRFQNQKILANGTLGMSRQFPAGDNIQANCTVSAEEPAAEEQT